MAQIVIGKIKINTIQSGAVVNIGDVIFNLPSNKIEQTAGNNSFCSGDGITSAQEDRQNNQGDRKALRKKGVMAV